MICLRFWFCSEIFVMKRRHKRLHIPDPLLCHTRQKTTATLSLNLRDSARKLLQRKISDMKNARKHYTEL